MLLRIFVLMFTSATVYAQTGTLKIVTNAAGSIKIDGENKGSIEANAVKKFDLKADDYIVQFFPQSGTHPITKEVSILVGKSETINFEIIAVNQQNNSASNNSNLLLPEMVFVEGGTFTMGCTAEQDDCFEHLKPAHSVTLSNYSIGKYEVTQEQWEIVMKSNPSNFMCCPNCPVENISWDDVQAFINKLNSISGKKYRLPTEAEWEYAARGGSFSRGYKYSGSNDLNVVGWYEYNSGQKTHPVGQKAANELGIYDMSGNVGEWCNDWIGNYNSSSINNPTGPSSGSLRVIRGYGWYYKPAFCMVYYRGNYVPYNGSSSLGFRLVLEP